ncbi:MAG: hypothetical protein KGL57_08125, partial [Burkholderiales bacterium]|nr:hypothetical protein [Burkholderiales bacterium]
MTAKRCGTLQTIALCLGLTASIQAAQAQGSPDVIDKLLKEFSPSTLSKEAQRKELEWFREAAKPFRGKRIMVVSEIIDTHV